MKKIYIIKINKLVLAAFLPILLLVCFFAIKDFNNNILESKHVYSNTSSNKKAKLAIIIDDFGQNRNGVKEIMAIKKHLTLAIMPYLKFSVDDALNAYKNRYEIIVHLPMESFGLRLDWLGPRPILTKMSRNEIWKITVESIKQIPHAKGANIHMGSKAGDDKRVIADVLDVIKAQNFYFVDSRASRHPIAKEIADEKGVRCFDRDIFIDGNKPKDYIKKRLDEAADIAIKKGFAVAIGHVGTEGGVVTAEAIVEKIPSFEEKNIELVYVSELVNYKYSK